MALLNLLTREPACRGAARATAITDMRTGRSRAPNTWRAKAAGARPYRCARQLYWNVRRSIISSILPRSRPLAPPGKPRWRRRHAVADLDKA